MKERPILFSAQMIRAILDGRKTMTRRIVKPQPGERWCEVGDVYLTKDSLWPLINTAAPGGYQVSRLRCPYGQVGDRLWTRETWWQRGEWLDKTGSYPDGPSDDPRDYKWSGWAPNGPEFVKNCVSYETPDADELQHGKWRKLPSIYMPRWASRINLEIASVRAERLQDISEDNARAEGVERDSEPCDHVRQGCDDIGCLGPGYRSGFGILWDQINGKRAPWSSNPLVWVIEFVKV